MLHHGWRVVDDILPIHPLLPTFGSELLGIPGGSLRHAEITLITGTPRPPQKSFDALTLKLCFFLKGTKVQSGPNSGLLKLTALILIMLPGGSEARPPRIAVFEFELRRVRLATGGAKILRDYLADRLAASSKYRIVPGDKTRAALTREQANSRQLCFAKSCQIRVGRALAADRSLSTRVMRIGKACTLSTTLFNLTTQVSEKGAMARGSCDEEGLRQAIDSVVGKISGPPPRETPSPAPPPVPPENSSGANTEQALPPEKAEVGTLIVEGSPKGARVDVKGPATFKGPAAAALPHTWKQVPPGSYQVLVRQAKFAPFRKAVTVQTDRTSLVTVKLVLAHGALHVGGEPSGARVEVFGSNGYYKRWGLSRGFMLNGVPGGKVTVRITRKGYRAFERKALVVGGSVSRVAAKLERVQSARRKASRNLSGLHWVKIPGGSFMMGTTEAGVIGAKPVRKVRVKTFALMKTEVAYSHYWECVNAGKCTRPDWESWGCNWGKKDRGDHPINCVNLKQARSFCAWLGGRLPNSAEWEYAATSGGKSWKYPWGNGRATCGRAVVHHLEGYGCGMDRTWPVCTKKDGNSHHGVCNLAGNVSELVEDCRLTNSDGKKLITANGTTTCISSGGGSVRGLSWIDSYSAYASIRTQTPLGTDEESPGLGFRCAK